MVLRREIVRKFEKRLELVILFSFCSFFITAGLFGYFADEGLTADPHGFRIVNAELWFVQICHSQPGFAAAGDLHWEKKKKERHNQIHSIFMWFISEEESGRGRRDKRRRLEIF